MDRAKQQLDSATSMLESRVRDMNAKRKEIDGINEKLSLLRGNLDAAVAPFQAEADRIRSMGDQNIRLYDITTRMWLSYNARTGLAWYRVSLPNGARLDKERVEAAMSGAGITPNIDYMELVKNYGLVNAYQTDNYASWARSVQKTGATTYNSSRRFSDNVSLETVTNEVIVAVFSGGQNLAASGQALEEQIILEWSDLLSWFKGVGQQDAEATTSAILHSVLERVTKSGSGAMPSLPEVQARSGEIDYIYNIAPKLDATKLVEPLRMLGIQAKVPASAKISVPHPAFSVAVSKQLRKTPDQAIAELKENLTIGPTIKLDQKLSDLKAVGLRGPDMGRVGDTWVRQMIANVFHDEVDQLARHHVGDLIFDLRNSDAAMELERRVAALALGNEGTAKVTSFILDGRSLSVELEISLIHRHYIGTVSGLLRQLEEKIAELDKPFRSKIESLGQLILGREQDFTQIAGSLDPIKSRLRSAQQEYDAAQEKLRSICSVSISGWGVVRHPACNLL